MTGSMVDYKKSRLIFASVSRCIVLTSAHTEPPLAVLDGA